MFSRKKKKSNPFERQKNKNDNLATEFRAIISKNLSVSIYESKKGTSTFVIKKELTDYDIDCTASEAPEKNYIGGEIIPWETITADIGILIDEVFPVNRAIQEVLGTLYNLRLNSIRLCIGSENNYVTVDETDLEDNNIKPTIKGLQEFIYSSKKGIMGFTVRHYDSKKGNLILLESSLDQPNYELKSIKLNIKSSLQTRGLYMQKEHKPYGLHLYIILRIRELSDVIVNLLEKLGVPIEIIYLKRTSAINKWEAIECEIDENNLTNYLTSVNTQLTSEDIKNIVYFTKRNQLDFEIAEKMSDVLNKMKEQREEEYGYNNESLTLEDITAAAKIVLEHFGHRNTQLELPSGLNEDIIMKTQNELLRFI
ncbi:MAG: hypothetical protein EU549_02935 [Promethearchaeota archaeon]|nr:MAG: hypothetical protein EU549_02935 [Candidatus Lokiarchaeota archaeon]